MPKWHSHPWTIACGAAFLTAVLAEISPLRLFSHYFLGWAESGVTFLGTTISVQRWLFWLGPIIGGALVLFYQSIQQRFRDKTVQLTFAGLYWKKLSEQDETIQPICKQCRELLQPRAQVEERKDRNGIPFLFTPDYPNSLYCPGCSQLILLNRPLEEIKKAANLALKSRILQA